LTLARLEDFRRELQGIGWLDPASERWTLTDAGAAVSSRRPDALARDLCVAHDRVSGHLVSRILTRLWELNPDHQGAVRMSQPDASRAPDTLAELRPWLAAQVAAWLGELHRSMTGLSVPPETEGLIEQVLVSLKDAWDKKPARERRKRLQEVLTDRLHDLLLGSVLAPSDVPVWHTRMDWAGLTLTARRLPGVEDRVWFPVGAFREAEDASFIPVQGLLDEFGRIFYRHTPRGSDAERRFADALYDAYLLEQDRRGVEYVSLLAARDAVCYRLRVGNAHFEELLHVILTKSLNRELPYAMAIEVDISRSERARLGSTLLVTLNGVPHYILSMRRR
jgi:hypothetical protein